MTTCNPQNKVDNDRSQQGDGQHGWSISIVEPALSSDPDALCSPVKRRQSVYHRCHGNECEEAGGNAAHGITEIEEANGETAKYDGKVEPREECAFIRKEDLGLDTCGEGYPFAWYG